MELKYSQTFQGMDATCRRAIQQIKEQRYEEYLRNDGRQDITIYGIAFCKKKCKIVAENL